MLGVILFLYVCIAGFVVPLKPGIYNASPTNIKAGQTLNLSIEGYNSHYKSAEELTAFLKFDSIQILKATDIKVNSEQSIEATFNIPEYINTKKKIAEATLIVDNATDGYSIMPAAVFVNSISKTPSQVDWNTDFVNDLHQVDAFAFPFRNILYETIRNTFFHVAIWMSMMILFIGALYSSIQYLRTRDRRHDIHSYSLTSTGIVYGLFGLASGAIWAKYTWGTFWTSDIKLNMAAIAMLLYAAYWILRSSIEDLDNKYKLSAIYNIFAFVALIPLIFVIPRLTDSLHPGNGGNPALGGEDLDNTLRMVFYPAIIGLTLLGVWISDLVSRYLKLENIIQEKENIL